MKIVFIRHAEPDYTIDSLTEKGWREAEILSERVAKWKVDDAYVSPLGRAKDTASFSLAKLGMEPQIRTWLQEFYYRIEDPETGKERIAWDFYPEFFTGQEDLHNKNEWYLTHMMQTGEMKKHFDEAVDGFNEVMKKHGYIAEGNGLYRIEKHSDETIVFFCHLGVSFVIIGYLLGIAPPVLWQGVFIAPTSITVLASEERDGEHAAFRIQRLGDASHLTNAGEPISQSGYFAEVFDDTGVTELISLRGNDNN